MQAMSLIGEMAKKLDIFRYFKQNCNKSSPVSFARFNAHQGNPYERFLS